MEKTCVFLMAAFWLDIETTGQGRKARDTDVSTRACARYCHCRSGSRETPQGGTQVYACVCTNARRFRPQPYSDGEEAADNLRSNQPNDSSSRQPSFSPRLWNLRGPTPMPRR